MFSAIEGEGESAPACSQNTTAALLPTPLPLNLTTFRMMHIDSSDCARPHAPLAGKVAIVTGSSRSIGASIAQRLAADGAHVVINYHRIAMDAERIACAINECSSGGRAIVVKADVSTVEGGRYVLDECTRQLGVPDILVLNAGMMGHTPLANATERDYDMHINTNVKGPLFMVQAAAKVMREGQSRS